MLKLFKIFLLPFFLFISLQTTAQVVPLSKDLEYWYSDYIYGDTTSKFESRSNIFIEPSDSSFQNYLQQKGIKRPEKQVWNRLFFRNHFAFKGDGYSLTIDPIFDWKLGHDLADKRTFLNNKSGIYINSTFYNKLKVFFSIVEGQASHDRYVWDWVNERKVSVGDGDIKLGEKYVEILNSVGVLQYQPNKYVTLEFGNGKNFIGNGYRSLILSDFASQYPYGKFELSFGAVKYSTLVGEHLVMDTLQIFDGLRQKKYASYHTLDLSITKKLNLQLFEVVYWEGDSMQRFGLDINYINPFVVFRAAETNLGSPDNMLLGSNLKYKLTKNIDLYGQFVLDEFYSKELLAGDNWWANKYAWQLGARYHKNLGKGSLYLQSEFNSVRPFTYSHAKVGNSATHLSQELAHPNGANFQELIGIANYSRKRYNFTYRFIYKTGGKENTDSTSIGSNIFRSYDLRENDYGNVIGQGIPFHQYLNSVTFSYLINPSNFFSFQLGYTHRLHVEGGETLINNNVWFGLRTAIYNNYEDF